MISAKIGSEVILWLLAMKLVGQLPGRVGLITQSSSSKLVPLVFSKSQKSPCRVIFQNCLRRMVLPIKTCARRAVSHQRDKIGQSGLPVLRKKEEEKITLQIAKLDFPTTYYLLSYYQGEQLSLEEAEQLVTQHEPHPELRRRHLLSFEGFARFLIC